MQRGIPGPVTITGSPPRGVKQYRVTLLYTYDTPLAAAWVRVREVVAATKKLRV